MNRIVLQNRQINWKEVTLVLITLLIAGMLFLPGYISNMRHVEARNALSEGKNIKLAMNLLSIDSYATGISLQDDSAASGLSAQAEDELKRLTGCAGEVQVISWNKQQGIPTGFWYRTGIYSVLYKAGEKGSEDTYEVYRMDRLLKFGD